MTLPRRVLRGQTFLVTRRCARRCFFFKPTRRALTLMRYCLTYATLLHEVEVHAFFFSTTHFHLVVTDPGSELPAFMQRLDCLLARSLNAHLGRGEGFFAPGSYSSVELDGRETILDKLVYVLVQGVKDGLVRRPEQWPGLHTLPRDVGTRTITASRPDFFFRSKGTKQRPALPDVVSFQLTVPPGFDDMPEDAFRQLLEERMEEELQAIYRQRKAEGKLRFLGVRAVMTQDPRDSAGDVFPERTLNPRIACKDVSVRRAKYVELQAWRHEYRAKWDRWRRGERELEFPAGTYAMRVHYLVNTGCSPPVRAA